MRRRSPEQGSPFPVIRDSRLIVRYELRRGGSLEIHVYTGLRDASVGENTGEPEDTAGRLVVAALRMLSEDAFFYNEYKYLFSRAESIRMKLGKTCRAFVFRINYEEGKEDGEPIQWDVFYKKGKRGDSTISVVGQLMRSGDYLQMDLVKEGICVRRTFNIVIDKSPKFEKLSLSLGDIAYYLSHSNDLRFGAPPSSPFERFGHYLANFLDAVKPVIFGL